MKLRHLIPCITLGLAVAAQAVTYSFNAYSQDDDITSRDDWTCSNTTEQYSFAANWNGSLSLGLGNAQATNAPPTTPTVALSQSYQQRLVYTNVHFIFAISDSVSDFAPNFVNRDQFGVSLTNSSGNLISIYFNPKNQSADPGAISYPPADPYASAEWGTSYSLDGGLTTIPLNLRTYEGGTYTFDLRFSANVNPLLSDFTLTLASGVNSLSETKTGIALDPNATTGQFNVHWNQIGTADYGTNVFLMDNLNLIPEPSSALLLGLAGLGLVVRRRRA